MIRRVLGFCGLGLLLSCAAAGLVLRGPLGLTKRFAPGTFLVYDIQPPTRASTEGLGKRTADAVLRRLDPTGNSRVRVVPRGDAQVSIFLPARTLSSGYVDTLLQSMGLLEFHVAVPLDLRAGEKFEADSLRASLETDGPEKAGPTMRWFEVERPDEVGGLITQKRGGKTYALLYTVAGKCLDHNVGLTWSIKAAYPTSDQRSGKSAIGFEFDERGSAFFGELSGANIGQSLAIVLDGKVLSAPRLQSRIEGNGIITGSFTARDIDYMVNILNAGALPAALSERPVQETTGLMELPPIRRAGVILTLLGSGAAAGLVMTLLGILWRSRRTGVAL